LHLVVVALCYLLLLLSRLALLLLMPYHHTSLPYHYALMFSIFR
jgi:hypothetical protein